MEKGSTQSVSDGHDAALGFVVIGRNEGERLKRGLKAIKRLCPEAPVIYVDSGSTDESVPFARSLGVLVVELDMSIPFTAARARNAGFARLMEERPSTEFVQFMDGDCELHPAWSQLACSTLASNPEVAIVSGRRVEKHPEMSIFNTLIDIEWNTPVGETLAVLGDMCVKADVFRAVGGFSEQIIAAEDDDFCLRVRAAGFKTWRLDALMSSHDANITRLSQWYQRSKRGGHGYANVNHLHGRGPHRYFRRQLISALFWGALLPAAVVSSALIAPWLAMALLIAYGLSILRSTLRMKHLGYTARVSVLYSLLVYTGKIWEVQGVVQYWLNHALSRKHCLIEYK
jgi:GT2 family glycosyltransferase